MSEWRGIVEFNNYEVSSDGRVRAVATGKELTLALHGERKYRRVCLCQRGRKVMRYVHLLVAHAFLPAHLPGGMSPLTPSERKT